MERTLAIIKGNGDVTTIVEKTPPLKDNEVLIKVHASLISPGTEMNAVKNLRNQPDPKADPIKFGYANAGEIIDLKGNCKNLQKGMRVAAMGGGAALHSNYACVPVNMVIPIPDGVSFEDATYACLGATSLQSVRRAQPQLGEYGIILGLGIVGNLAAQLSILSGARVIAWEGTESRIEMAKKCGIKNIANFKVEDTVEKTKKFAAPYGADFSIIAFGGSGTDAFNSVVKCMKVSPDSHQMGKIILVGGTEVLIHGGAALGNLDIHISSRTGPGYHDSAYEYGIDYPNAFVQFTTQRNLREIIELISEKRLLVEPITTHKLPLEKVGEAADLLVNHPDKAVGIVLTMKH